MCGIAGYIGKRDLEQKNLDTTLSLMQNRGPDNQTYRQVSTLDSNNLNVVFLHSRLSIIDLSERSNQPLCIGPCTIIFNGEIYNYLELRKELEVLGVNFTTSSDTEVLLQSYLTFGTSCFEKLEGMWSFAIWDDRIESLLLSRDRFGEKPLYYHRSPEGLYFASETKFLKTLSQRKFAVNDKQILRYLALGYKSLYKQRETFFEDIYEIPPASFCLIGKKNLNDSTFHIKAIQYWKPDFEEQRMSLEDAIEGTRHHLLESVRIRLRSDVPLAFCLSGGVDSASIASIAHKIFNCDITTFSIIDKDPRYNEEENIKATVNDLGCKSHLIMIPQSQGIGRLRKLIKYHDAPIATTTYYVHSLLSEQISLNNFKVAFSGTSADELFTGYYDHFLLHLAELESHPKYDTYLSDWEKHIKVNIRNPILSNPKLYSDTPHFREHVFDNSKEFTNWLTPLGLEKLENEFTEVQYCTSLLKNRMLNELTQEATPVILHEDDLNSMFYSIENRSPFLDTKLFEFAYSIPSEHLIRNGFGKYVLRESVKGILNDSVRLDRKKKGFNASINSLIDLKDKEVRDTLLDPTNKVFDFVYRDKILPLFELDNIDNQYSKFLFNFINVQLFLEDLS